MSLIEAAKKTNLTRDDYLQPLELLKELLQLKTASGAQPFCNLIVAMDNWLPEVLVKDTSGIEIQNLSVIGPFMSLSAFAEDSVSGFLTTYCENEDLEDYRPTFSSKIQ